MPAGMGDVAIFTELGRFMLAPYGCTCHHARIHEKHIYKEYIGVDACAANLMRPAMYGAYHHITVLGKEDTALRPQVRRHRRSVREQRQVRHRPYAAENRHRRHCLVIHDTGAHGFSMGYNYNGKLRSAEVLLKEDGSHQLIRRAETPEDYFATFDFSPFFKK